MINTVTLDDGVQCVVASAYDGEFNLDIRIHWHQPGTNLLGFQVIAAGEVVAETGEMEHG